MLKVNRDCCDAVAGNTRAGKLLHQLVFWLNSPRAPIFDGHRWVAFTCEQWAVKTNLSFDQIRLILRALLAAGLIVREQHKYGGKVPNFIRLSAACIEALCATQAALNNATQVARNNATLKNNYKDITKEETKYADDFVAASSDSTKIGKSPEEQNIGNVVKFPGQGGPEMNAAEVAKKFAEAQSQKIDTLKPDGGFVLYGVWKSYCVANKIAAPYHSAKFLSQLKYLMKCWPEGQAQPILAFTLSNWFDFTYATKETQGAFNTPGAPQIAFLMKHAHVAVDVWNKSKSDHAAKKAPVEMKPVQSIAQKPSMAEQDDKPITFEEIQALEAEMQVAS